MVGVNSALHSFVKVAFRKQTYMNILYLLFSFPLGTAYFIFLVTGLSFGLGTLLAWIGIPVLLLIFLAWWEVAAFERQMAIWLLGIEISPMSPESFSDVSLSERFLQRVKSPVTWKALLFLLVKFPLGIFSLVLMVTLFALSVGMLFAPVLYVFGTSDISSFHGALFISIAGVLVGFISLHVLNLLAAISGNFAKLMLGSFEKEAL